MSRPEWMPVGHLVMVFVTSAFWGTVVALRMIWDLLRHGPEAYFYLRSRPQRPAVLDDPDLGTHGYARLKNIRLHYVEKGPKDAPLVLFVHGFPEFWYTWRYQLREFGKDFRAVALDMRGYSESERPQGIGQYRIELLCDDIKDFILHMGYEKCFLVGHDWGGAVSCDFASRFPNMVERLVLCNIPHGSAFRKHLQSSRKQFLSSWYMFFFQIPWLPELLSGVRDVKMIKQMLTSKRDGIKPRYITDDDVEAYVYTFKDRADRVGPINYYRAALRYKRGWSATTRVCVPSLIIWGDRDRFLDKAMADSSKEFFDGEFRVAHIDSATHWVQQDEPERVNQEIRNFISQ